MNVRITFTRGDGIDMLNYDREFDHRLMEYLTHHEADGLLNDPNSLYNRLRRSHRALIEAVAQVLGEDGNKPFSITVAVEGEKKIYPLGSMDY